ncbi:hypothetical protein [Sphingomonas trueperi]|uniref:hypothetical protein n=1 Tax=Sphingomonas trueperi TaxID=53317 RepID=UPI0011C35C31
MIATSRSLSGSNLTASNLTHFARASKRNILNFTFVEENPYVPIISLVHVDDDGQAMAFENCMLWLPQSGGRCWLVPDNNQWGAFRIDDQFKLRHNPRLPARSEKAAFAGKVRAYERLAQITIDQLIDGCDVPAPQRLEERAI